MSSIKLTADSGGGTFEIKAPASGSNARVLNVPDTASGTVLTTTNPKSGNVIQVVQDTFTGIGSFGINNTIYVPNQPSATLTPASSSNKILVDVYLNTTLNDNNSFAQLILYREIGGSGGFSAVSGAIGDAADTRRRVTAAFRSTSSTGYGSYQVNIKYLDSPNTTSSVQYKVAHCHAYAGYIEHFINKTNTDADGSTIGRMYSSMILSEIAG
tara:strand:+ start:702 stop:1340 length:639 start_codon:yes stop_codon:yes gene_type:complete